MDRSSLTDKTMVVFLPNVHSRALLVALRSAFPFVARITEFVCEALHPF